MDVSLVFTQRLEQLGLGRKDLAAAAQVTESHVSQLVTNEEATPAPGRTDVYDKLWKLPNGELAKLTVLQRKEELKRKLGDPRACRIRKRSRALPLSCDLLEIILIWPATQSINLPAAPGGRIASLALI